MCILGTETRMRVRKLFPKAPSFICDDGAGSTLTVTDHIFSFGNECALIER